MSLMMASSVQPRRGLRFLSRLCAAALALGALALAPADAAIQHVANGFLFTGTNSSVLISDTNGSILSITTGSGTIAAGGEAGLWSVSYVTNGSSAKTGSLNAASFSTGSPSNTFQWALAPSSNLLYLTYSNAALTVVVTLSNREDGVDLSAALSPRLQNVLSLTLPAPLRFDPSGLQRFIAPSHSSDGVGMAYNKTYFQAQPEDSPASWKNSTVGPSGYISLYGGECVYTNYDSVPISFTTNGVAWLGASLSSKWASASAVVHRPPAAGQADVVLLDSPHGAFLSGSHLGGTGLLMRIGGLVDATDVSFSLDVVIATIEHLSQTAAGRTNVALLSLVRGPVTGKSWPSEVSVDEWRDRLRTSAVLASNGIDLIELSNIPEMNAALVATNYLAILNPYGELVPASLSGGVPATVTNIGSYVRAGGHWFEVGGYSFYQALQPELYYTNNLLYPPAFADFYQVETTNGNASLYGVQPVPSDPWAGQTNLASLFIPGHLVWGGDTTGGWLQRAFGTYVATNQIWQSPVVRLSLGQTAAGALHAYAQANDFSRSLTNKMAPTLLDQFKQSVMIRYGGVCTQLTAYLPQLPTPAVLHFEQYLYAGFDKQYPDHLPPSTNFGTPSEFTNFLAQARQSNRLTMPYTNPTFWGDDPRSPVFTNDDPLQRNLDGSVSFEEYFGNGGFNITPWHPTVQAANRNTRGQFITNYPVDILFQDQVGARTWQYDLSTSSPSPYAYASGLAAIAAEDSQVIPVSTENLWDRLINAEAQSCGLAWGLAPTTNAPVWRRYLRDRYAPSTWQVFPVAQYLAHDKLSMIYNDLNAAVHNHEVMAWTLGLGYGMTYVVNAVDLDKVATRQWLLWIDRMQKSVAARYIGQPVNSFSHQWGTNTVNPDNGVMTASYGPVDVVGNLGPQQMVTNGWTLPGYGYLATAPGLVAAHLIPPGGSNAAPYVAETNTSGGVNFWIYAPGGTNTTIILPAGFNGAATVQVDTNNPVAALIQNNILTITLPASTNTLLWSGQVTPEANATLLIDFGRHDSGINGLPTVSPDLNGNYWNNLGPVTQFVSNGTKRLNLVNTANGATAVGIEMTSDWEANGILNGGLLTPSPALLDLLAITNATMDYFFTTTSDTFRITGLNTGSTYDLTFFGTRDSTETRISTYTVGTNTISLTTSGTGIGAGGVNQNNNTTAVLRALAPDAAGALTVTVSRASGFAAYLGILQIDEHAASAPAVPGILASPGSLSFASTEGGADPAGQSFGLTNSGSGTLNYTLSSNVSWLSVSPSTGSLAAAAGQQVTVSVNNTGLQAGTSNATVTIMDASASNSPQTISVSLAISSALTVTTQEVILVDFGNDSSYHGASVVNPDGNGSYWNSVWAGAYNANLVNHSNQATAVDIGFDAAVGTDNFNGPAGQVDAAALGRLGGATNAVNDYYVNARFQIQSLDTSRTYRLTFFGSHKFSANTSTVYTLHNDANYTQALRSVSLNVQVPGTPSLHNSNTVAVLTNVTPQANGRLYVKFEGDAGGNGYLNAMMMEALAGSTSAPPPDTASTQAVFLVDFGRHDGLLNPPTTNGYATVSPDYNGNYWNNIGSVTNAVTNGTRTVNMVTTTNGASTLGVEITSGTWGANGILNGGLLNPSPALLGMLAITNATMDYFFTQGTDTFKLTGLNTALVYNLEFFGTRDNTATRITTYTVGANSVNLTSSGTGIGDGGANLNNNTTAVLRALAPNASGEIPVTVTANTGGFGYVGILKVEQVYVPPSTSPAPSIAVSPASLNFSATAGGANPAAQNFGLTNTGSAALNYTIATNVNWLSVSPVSGTLATNAGQEITVTVSSTGLQPGTSNAVITITDPAAANSPYTVNVSFSIQSTNPILTIFGSSVAKGWASSGMTSGVTTNGSWTNSYSYFITRQLTEQGGYYVTNASTPGDNTAMGISRFPTYVVPRAPTYVLLGYSLGNEGLANTTDPTASAVTSNFLANLQNLVGLCRTNGFYPVISSVYPRGDYTADNYIKLKQAHLAINAWNVPSLNLLTPVDDGNGRWISGYWADGAHPNDAGYAELYHSFVPSLLDAVAAGRTNSPQSGSATNFARLTYRADVSAPLTFTPSNTVHSFTTAFRLRTSATGTIAAVRSGADYATLEVRTNQLVYVSRTGTETTIATNLADGAWHDVAVSARYALSNTAVYVDGALAGSVAERFVPDQFILGGPGASERAPTPQSADLDSWCVYRAGWTVDEALAQKNGALQQSSMEIGAMLDEATFPNGGALSNAAQSLSTVAINTPDLAAWTPETVETTKLLVFGSSVAKGYHGPGSPGFTNGSYILGYAGRLTPVLETTGWTVTNGSVGGNDTAALLARFDADAVPVNPDVLLIGLSMGNEGLLTNNADTVFESFRSGLTNLIQRSRSNGFYPVVTLNYPNQFYSATHYQYIKRMNLLMNAWDVPSVNLLGPVDDGTGKWADGYWNDNAHPNPAGHEELYYSIVPSLFDAIAADRTNTPHLTGTHGYARLQGMDAQPLTFAPSRTMRSFNAAFRVRAGYPGTVAAMMTATGAAAAVGGSVELRANTLVYVATNGAEIVAPVNADGGAWMEVALSHSYARGLTMLYVDGVLAGTTPEHLAPVQFVLGGPGALTNRPAAPAEVDLQDWCVYRAPWTPDEAMAQHTGALQQASMELCAPLDDAVFTQGGSASNRAQSLALSSITGTNLAAGTVVLPPENLLATSPAYNTVSLTWSDRSSTESGFVVERRPSGGSAFWSNRVVVSANTTNYTDYGVPEGTYEYRVSSQEGLLQSDYAGGPSITVSHPPFSPVVPVATFRFTGAQVGLSFVGSNAVAYLLQFSTNLLDPAGWHTVHNAGSPVSAIGNGTDTNTLNDAELLDRTRMYRLINAP